MASNRAVQDGIKVNASNGEVNCKGLYTPKFAETMGR